jgi:hypothetical protein
VPQPEITQALVGRSPSRLDDAAVGGGHLIANALRAKRGNGGSGMDGDETMVANTMKSQRGKGGGGVGPEETLVAAPLTKGSATGKGVNAPGRRQEDDVNIVPYTFDWQAGGSKDTSWRGKSRQWIDDKPGGPTRSLVSNKTLAVHMTQDPITGDEFSPALGKTSHGMGVAFSENQRAEVLETEVAHQLTSGGGKPGQGYSAVREGMGVRRLTPRECERLQGLPDDWTLLDEKTPDSRRYSALGDAVTATVTEWIGERLGLLDKEGTA